MTTPIQHQRSGVSFPEISDINLGLGPTNLDDIPDMSFFDDSRTEAVEKRVSELEKEKAAIDEKVKNLEAKNVVLKNEVQSLNPKVNGLEAGNVALNEVVQGLVTTKAQLITSNVMLMSANELLKKMVNDHEDEIETNGYAFCCGGGGNLQIVKYYDGNQVIDYMDDSQNEEKEDADTQGESGLGTPHDEESAGIFTEVVPINSIPADIPKVIYLCHDVEEGEVVHSYSCEELMEMMGINDESKVGYSKLKVM
ncbi:hypothetical protein Hanom_Chr05g00424911 [Helianthus anomalus]